MEVSIGTFKKRTILFKLALRGHFGATVLTLHVLGGGTFNMSLSLGPATAVRGPGPHTPQVSVRDPELTATDLMSLEINTL